MLLELNVDELLHVAGGWLLHLIHIAIVRARLLDSSTVIGRIIIDVARVRLVVGVSAAVFLAHVELQVAMLILQVVLLHQKLLVSSILAVVVAMLTTTSIIQEILPVCAGNEVAHPVNLVGIRLLLIATRHHLVGGASDHVALATSSLIVAKEHLVLRLSHLISIPAISWLVHWSGKFLRVQALTLRGLLPLHVHLHGILEVGRAASQAMGALAHHALLALGLMWLLARGGLSGGSFL